MQAFLCYNWIKVVRPEVICRTVVMKYGTKERDRTMIKYNFSIPESDIVAPLNGALFITMKAHPEWFYDDFKIDSAYGCPKNCIWNGNREFAGKPNSMEEVAGIILSYKQCGITYRLTFTNFLLKEKDLADTYGNEIARVAEKFGSMAIVANSIMYNFIRDKYPGLDISWSTTTDFGNSMEQRVEKINQLSQEHVVVVPFDMNNKPLLRELQHPENIEVLVNEMCIDDCPMRREHERQSNLYNMGLIDKMVGCLMKQYKGTDKWKMHSMINRKGLDKYVERGINRFKFSGRTALLQTYSAYSYYFVKEEYQKDFYNSVNDIRRRMLLKANILQDDVYDARRKFIDDYGYDKAQHLRELIEITGAENDILW